MTNADKNAIHIRKKFYSGHAVCDCVFVNNNIDGFISGSMESQETLAFIDHIKTCAECKEELSIKFLVSEGLNKIDKAESFNLNNELKNLIEINQNKADGKIKTSRFLMGLFIVLAIVGGYFLSTIFYV